MSPHVEAAFIAPELLATAPGWLPMYFAGPSAIALRAGFDGHTIFELGGHLLEGWRVSETPGVLAYDPRAATTPVYRQSNIGRLRLELDTAHWASPEITGRWCVEPNDVVVNKIAPVRAAFVSKSAKRHPVDGNSLIIRGLSRPDATWVALCLNQPGYEQLMLLGSGVLRRVGLGALESLRVPVTPSPLEGLSARLRDALDEQMLTREALEHVHAEADEATRPAAAKTRPLDGGAFLTPEAVSHESWLPSATALRAEQRTLEEELGWVAVGELASFDERTRLPRAPEGGRALRLRDVGDDLLVSRHEDMAEELIPNRMMARPLVPGEVLLSTVGSSFRTAYVDDDVPEQTFPTDGWVRLRFRETPAAWALLLSTDAIRAQAARLAVGSVLQFVPPSALRSLRVPVPPREVRDRWQRAVERHHAQRRAQDRVWSALMRELSTTFDAVHHPFAAAPARTQEAQQ